jgi:hypothetical protein
MPVPLRPGRLAVKAWLHFSEAGFVDKVCKIEMTIYNGG